MHLRDCSIRYETTYVVIHLQKDTPRSLSENRHLGVYAYRKSTLSVQNREI